jgi:hypothetical protein
MAKLTRITSSMDLAGIAFSWVGFTKASGKMVGSMDMEG